MVIVELLVPVEGADEHRSAGSVVVRDDGTYDLDDPERMFPVETPVPVLDASGSIRQVWFESEPEEWARNLENLLRTPYLMPLVLTETHSRVDVPDDAGEHSQELARILRRFEMSFPAVIDCGPGWYPLLTRLDKDLAAIHPDYVIQQIKEKFGGLRYYAEFPEHLGRASDAFEARIREAEEQSQRICERCGREGQQVTCGYRSQTLCVACSGPTTETREQPS